MTRAVRRVQLRLESASATVALGAELAALLEPGDVVLLSGPLGAGKTTLVKGAAHALGASEEATSPTFTLLRTYDTEPVLAHVDCWRLDQLHDLDDLGLDELLDEGAVALLEWGEVAEPLFGTGALRVELEPASAGAERLAVLEGDEGRWGARLCRLEQGRAPVGGP